MYEPAIRFKRRNDEQVSSKTFWDREDKAFFAAGACHILAYAFMELHADEGFQIIFIKPRTSQGTHVYVTDGEWAFDFNGWTKESELLEQSERAEKENNPDWSYQKLIITESIESFCQKNNHCQPKDFCKSPWERAKRFVEQYK